MPDPAGDTSKAGPIARHRHPQAPVVTMAAGDCLGLSRHPRLVAAAQRAIDAYGVQGASAGRMPLPGPCTSALEGALAAFAACPDAMVFASGQTALAALLQTLVSPANHVVIDAWASPALFRAARAVTAHVHPFAHLSTCAAAGLVAHLRRETADTGILLLTESLFAADSTVPDLGAMQLLAAHHGATLAVNVTQDLGCSGTTGRGALETQGMLGEVDVVFGSFANALAANGGFVASRHAAMRPALAASAALSEDPDALTPLQALIVLEALEIVQSPDGQSRRDRVLGNAQSLRAALRHTHFRVPGEASPIVPVVLDDPDLASCLTRLLATQGALAPLAGTAGGMASTMAPPPHWPLRVSFDHSPEDIAAFTAAARRARRLAQPRSSGRTPDLDPESEPDFS